MGVTATGLVLGLNGCLINRVAEVKGQFCDFDSNFELVFAETADFNFNSPVLLDTDIEWIAGAPPTEFWQSEEGLSMVYVLEKSGPETTVDDEIRVGLKFDRIDDHYKLTNIRFDPKLNAMINPDFLDEATIDTATRNMCELGWSMASTRVEMDIPVDNLDEMPSRMEILDLLGPPRETNTTDHSYTYEYHLKGHQPDPMKARFTVWFDDTSQQAVRIDSEYSHFRTSADFVKKKMLMKVKI